MLKIGSEEWWDALETTFDQDSLVLLRETIPELVQIINSQKEELAWIWGKVGKWGYTKDDYEADRV